MSSGFDLGDLAQEVHSNHGSQHDAQSRGGSEGEVQYVDDDDYDNAAPTGISGPRVVDDAGDFYNDAGEEGEYGEMVDDGSDAGGSHAEGTGLLETAGSIPAAADDVPATAPVTESAPSETDSELEALLSVWERAPTRLRIFSVVDPSVCETMAQPATWAQITRVYQTIYFVLVLANTVLFLLSTFRQFSQEPWLVLPLIALQGLFTVDLIVRIASFPSAEFLPMMLVDLLSIIAAFLCLLNMAAFLPELIFLALLRALRLFLVTRLFVRTETFRDINLALRTFEESFKPLMVFVVLMGVFLCLFSTFVFISERGRFDVDQELWFRPCKEFSCSGETLSPFQSIPDALWLIMQSMTTVGYGDAVPTTTLGRTITGAAIIGGVFVIAFPSMVLIGNLDATRRDFFEREQLEELNRAYGLGRDGKASEQGKAQGGEDEDEDDQVQEGGNAKFSKTMTFAQALQLTMREEAGGMGHNDDILFATLPGMARSDSASSSSHNSSSRTGGATKKFSFMGNAAREISHLGRGEYTYQALLQVLCDPDDRLPIISSVAPVPGYTDRWTGLMTLVIDDIAAQEAASEVIAMTAPGSFAHAHPIYGLEVTMRSTIPGVRMRRRCDIGEVRDAAIPLVLELRPPAPKKGGTLTSDDAAAFVQTVRKQLGQAKLRAYYATKPYTAAMWVQNVPITSVMLASTPFIVDLKDIAINVSIASLWREERRKNASPWALQRRNLAFVTPRHLADLVFPVFKKCVDSKDDIIRNSGEFSSHVVQMITLHCRCLRKIDLPTELHSAIYDNNNVGLEETVYEVDVDYFRTVDWPLGVATVELSEKPKKVETIITCGDGAKLEQPGITDIAVFRRASVEVPSMPRPPSLESSLNSQPIGVSLVSDSSM